MSSMVSLKPNGSVAVADSKPRKHYPRHTLTRSVFMKSRDANVEVKPRLFKGHRI